MNECLSSSNESPVSLGTFMALKPFYIRSATVNDFEMCCCKKHLHARCLKDCAKQQNLELGNINTYETFFDFLNNSYEKESTTHLSWTCTPNKNTIYSDIETKWKVLKDSLKSKSDNEVKVQLMCFEKIDLITKSGKNVKYLKAISTPENMSFIVDFISKRLALFIHHQNQLKHYHSSILSFKEHSDTISIENDFSKIISNPVKYEPQPLHWSHCQVTLHSVILKNTGEKSYHAYFSDDRKHDQVFVKLEMKEMMNEAEIVPYKYIIIESDNFSSQYKSAPHFHHLQDICNKYELKIIHVYSVAGHGKGQVDHVGGLAKVAIRREIGAGPFFANLEDMVEFLNNKLGQKN